MSKLNAVVSGVIGLGFGLAISSILSSGVDDVSAESHAALEQELTGLKLQLADSKNEIILSEGRAKAETRNALALSAQLENTKNHLSESKTQLAAMVAKSAGEVEDESQNKGAKIRHANKFGKFIDNILTEQELLEKKFGNDYEPTAAETQAIKMKMMAGIGEMMASMTALGSDYNEDAWNADETSDVWLGMSEHVLNLRDDQLDEAQAIFLRHARALEDNNIAPIYLGQMDRVAQPMGAAVALNAQDSKFVEAQEELFRDELSAILSPHQQKRTEQGSGKYMLTTKLKTHSK